MSANHTSVLSTLILAATISGPVSAAELVVKVATVEQATGKMMISIYDSESNFRETVAADTSRAAIKGEMKFSFPDLATGDYAIMVFHDLNDNGKLDSNLLGLPKEPWGGSLQGKSVFGAPKWSDTQFNLTDAGLSVSITLN